MSADPDPAHREADEGGVSEASPVSTRGGGGQDSCSEGGGEAEESGDEGED